MPRGYTANPQLAQWVSKQRVQYKLLKEGKKSQITNERVAKLEELDFVWNEQEAKWQERYDTNKSREIAMCLEAKMLPTHSLEIG